MPTELEQRARDRRFAEVTTVPMDTMDRLLSGRATEGDQMLAYNALAALQAQQPGAQAVAWHTDDHLTDKSATTYDPVIADRWRAKGWPVTPHYLAPQPPSIPELSDEDVVQVRSAFNLAVMRTPGTIDQIYNVAWKDALTTYTARLRERIGGGV